MIPLAKLYIQQFKATSAMMFQYRAMLLLWMIGHVLEPLVFLIVWTVVSGSGGGSVGDYSTREFAGYFIVLMIVNQFTYTWIMYEFEWRVREGILSFALLKPVHPIHSDIADNISAKLITFPAMMVIAVALGVAFQAALSPQPWAIILFIPVLVLAFIIRFIVEYTLALAAFWTTRVSAINQTYFILMLFLSGQIAPLALLPGPVQLAATILPFRWTVGFPVELLLGRLTVLEALWGIGIQAVWVLIGIMLLRAMWKAGVKNYSAVGQ
jgi:ABC-2 type transport system permease protein